MSREKSAIEEVREQLFLDTADGPHLNAVSSNLGLDRPLFTPLGFGDDSWRAIVRKIAIDKMTVNTFHRVIEICVGPQKTRIATLSDTFATGLTELTLNDSSNLVQVGTVVIDPGLATEETVRFRFRDLTTQEIFLLDETQYVHNQLDEADDYLRTSVSGGSSQLPLFTSSEFPTTGYPYPVILDRGNEFEEVVSITNNNTTTNTLTCSYTTYAHTAPTVSFVRKQLSEDTYTGRTFIRLNSTRTLPNSGFLRINFGTGTEEVIEFTSNQIDDQILHLKRPLVYDHSTAESVELMRPGCSAETVSVMQQGSTWDVFQTDEEHGDHVQIYLPNDQAFNLGIRDASWLHTAVSGSGAVTTTLVSGSGIGDTLIYVANASGFPDEAGLIRVGLEDRFYIFKDEDNSPHTLTLTDGLDSAHISGTTVTHITYPYTSTDLADGNLRDSSGDVQFGRWPGPYIYDPTTYAPSSTYTTLSGVVVNPTRLVYDQVAGATNIEVEDAFIWPAPPFGSFDQIRIGEGSGFEETRTITDRTLKEAAKTAFSANFSSGVSTITVLDSTDFPESDGLAPARYRIHLGRTTPNYEIVLVSQNTAGSPGTFTLISPTVNSHTTDESVELVNDTLTVDALTLNHDGPKINPSEFGCLVQPLFNYIAVDSTSNFTLSGGNIWLNFGKERLNARSKIVSNISPVILELEDTSKFPTTDYPYKVVVGEGFGNEERFNVTNNDTSLNRLTFSDILETTYSGAAYVSFESGVPKVLEYSSVVGNTLTFNSAITINSRHTDGERVTLSDGLSIPDIFGSGYALKMPPDPSLALKYLIDLVRAAGVFVTFINNR